MAANSKNRLLFLKEIFEERTDAENGITVKELQDLYEKQFFVKSTPETIIEDIHALEDYGLEILRISGRRNDYRLLSRKDKITPFEIRILIDLLQSTRSLADEDVKALIEKLEKMCSKHERKRLRGKVIVHSPCRTANNTLPDVVNVLHEAISDDKQVRFKYFHYDIRKKKDYLSYGEPIRVSPYAIIYRDGMYKLLAVPAGKKELVLYRLEHMEEVSISRADRLHQEVFAAANIDFYTRANYFMSASKPVSVVLKAHYSMMDDIVERYGINVKTAMIDEDYFTAEVVDYSAPEFHSWLLAHGGKIKVVSPKRMLTQLTLSARKAFESKEIMDLGNPVSFT